MKSKFIIYMDEDIAELLGDESSNKFSSKVTFDKKIIIDIESKDISGLQAAVNSYINKIKIFKNIKELDI